jgi:hypothetical protein
MGRHEMRQRMRELGGRDVYTNTGVDLIGRSNWRDGAVRRVDMICPVFLEHSNHQEIQPGTPHH